MNSSGEKGFSCPWIIVVSGLPRSGTSMMMRMLEAGGWPIFTDNMRKADESNPKGYFELEKVKNLRYDSSWLTNSNGRAIKVVSPLLRDLPWDRGYAYRIIFMRRDLNEIIASQGEMNRRLNQSTDARDEGVLMETYRKHLNELDEWLSQRSRLEVLNIDYSEVIRKPAQTARSISAFLGKELNIQAMTNVVDEALYRQRGKGAGLASSEVPSDEKKVIEDQLKRLGYL